MTKQERAGFERVHKAMFKLTTILTCMESTHEKLLTENQFALLMVCSELAGEVHEGLREMEGE